MVGFCRGDSSLSVLIEGLRKELARWLQGGFSGSDYPFSHFLLNSVRSLFLTCSIRMYRQYPASKKVCWNRVFLLRSVL